MKSMNRGALWIRSLVGLAAVALVAAACGDDGYGDDATSTPTAGAVATATVAGSPPAGTTTAPTGDITIDVPAEGANVDTPFSVTGTATVFEAVLWVDVLDEDGEMLCERRIMASSGTEEDAPWSTTLAVPPPDAPEDVTVRAYSFSAMDGSMINLVERSAKLSTERPSIFMTSPACGASVAPGSVLAVQGRALVFEAALTVELRDEFGNAVVTQNVIAANGTEESDFSASLAVPATVSPGFYDLVAFNHSAMDGSVENEFSMQIVVEP